MDLIDFCENGILLKSMLGDVAVFITTKEQTK